MRKKRNKELIAYDFFKKPYDEGYKASDTEGLFDRKALLKMDEDFEGAPSLQALSAPLQITLRLEAQIQVCDNAVTVERCVNGKSGGVTALYQPGNVLQDGSQNLKPLSKAQGVDFLYQGSGFYLDDHDLIRPFYEGQGVEGLIQIKKGARVFRKPFAVRGAPIRLETRAVKEGQESVGFGKNTYPLYPYGGYMPPRGTLLDMGQTYAFPGVDTKGGGCVTALKLYRSSFFEPCGGFPPLPFFYDQKNWVFPQSVRPLEQMSVGQALCEGHLTFEVKDAAGDSVTYASYGYEQPGGSVTQVQVHCAPQDSKK
ncbi:hypothetical protein OAN21_02045 [Alphaproteobacteria bacterium]|nr:hypothetical protein [Alphaproteobacteria bacterium]